MANQHRSSLYSLMALTILIAACGESTAPNIGMEFDSEATLEAYASMDSLFASPSLKAFQALSGRTSFGAAPAITSLATVLPDASVRDGGRTFAVNLARQLNYLAGSSAGPAAAQIISDTHRGRTFVYDAGEDEYVYDPEREGAPETGVRFVLYETNLFGTPVSEEEIGYTDFYDEGDDSEEDVVLHLTVFAYETTVLDYRTTLDIAESGGTLGVQGFLQDPHGGRLDFDIDAASTQVGEGDPMLDVAFELAIDEIDFSIVGAVRGVDGEEDGDGAVDITVQYVTDSIRLDVETVEGQINGTVFVNGGVFAVVTGAENDPDIASATGEPLSLREILVLHRIIDGVEDVFDFLEDLLDPVDELIILAIIL